VKIKLAQRIRTVVRIGDLFVAAQKMISVVQLNGNHVTDVLLEIAGSCGCRQDGCPAANRNQQDKTK